MYLWAIISILYIIRTTANEIKYQPTWESLDSRPLPQWYDNAKIGIFIHWGVYAVPSFGPPGGLSSEWFWAYWKGGNVHLKDFMRKNYPPGFTYQEFSKDFKTEFYDPQAWVKLFKASGAKYVVLTSKHHDGYTLWPSTYSFSWNAQETGPHRDLLGELAAAIRNTTDLKFGLYYSLYEWYNPLYLSDKKTHFKNNTYIVNKAYPEMLELVKTYSPEVVWADGDWEADDAYFKSKEFLAWLYNESPVKDTVVGNDRWGSGIPCHHGGYYTCTDRFNPGVLQPHKWENAMSIDKHSWGYRRNANIGDYLTTHELITTVVETVSCGGNILIDVGPTSDGRIDPIFQERLLDIGQWLAINGEAIYNSRPWLYQNDTLGSTWYTSRRSAVYAITLEWPKNNVLELTRVTDLFSNENIVVTLLGNSGTLWWTSENNKMQVMLPYKSTVKSKWAWTIKIENHVFESYTANEL